MIHHYLFIPQKLQKVNSLSHKLKRSSRKQPAFTIVELLIVIVVIAILAAITIISYTGITNRARETSLKSDLQSTSTKLKLAQIDTGSYPSSLSSENTAKSGDNQLTYTGGGTTFCLKATNPSLAGKAFYITQEGSIGEGDCPVIPFASGSAIQTATTANCPATRTLAVDARDNHTYWIQKLADDNCWMLTNLAYAGGGTNTYNDTMPTGDGISGTLNNGTSDTSTTYTNAKYYIDATNSNSTTIPSTPSTSTDGGTTGKQYGYYYNWCAAMKAQTGTTACLNATTPLPDTTKSICPAGWRLPTGGSGGEFATLNTAINGGSTSSDAGLIALPWLAQRGGYWVAGFSYQGSSGSYWSSMQNSSSTSAYYLSFGSTYVSPSNGNGKDSGRAVRCVAQS